MSFCCLRSSLALLFGAGVLGGFPSSAAAGDKIEFSPAAETLAKPKVDRPDLESADAFAGFDFGKPGPQMGIIYPMPPPAPAPSRRNNGSDLLNETGGLGPGLDSFEQGDGFGKSAWDSYDTNYSSKPGGNASNYWSAARAWENADNPEGLGRGADRLDPRYGQSDARLDSLNSLERRDRPADFVLGATEDRSWASRREDASGSGGRTSLADALKQQNKSFFGANSGPFKSISSLSDSRAASVWGSLSLLPPDRSSTSPTDALEPGYNGSKDPAARAPSPGSGKTFGNPDAGNPGGLPAMRPFDDGLGLGSQASQTPAARKPPPLPASAAAQPQRGGAFLSKPKDPNSVFK